MCHATRQERTENRSVHEISAKPKALFFVDYTEVFCLRILSLSAFEDVR